MEFLVGVEETFQQVYGWGLLSKTFFVASTAIGAIIVLYHCYKLPKYIYDQINMYVISQFGRKVNYLKRYGQWAVITGATDGIGLAMARELARRGHSILVVGRNERNLEKTKKSLEEEPNVGKVETVEIELSELNLDDFERIRRQIDPDRRDIGILINNAGIINSTLTRFDNLDIKALHGQVGVNILAMVYLTRMILPGMIARKRGLVVNVSSLIGSWCGSFAGVYAVAKTFMDCFSKQLNDEYAGYPIDIVNLRGGSVLTKMYRSFTKIHDNSSLLILSPEEYAKSALNACAARVPDFGGYWTHDFKYLALQLAILLKVQPLLYRLFLRHYARDFRSSPSPSRRLRLSPLDKLD